MPGRPAGRAAAALFVLVLAVAACSGSGDPPRSTPTRPAGAATGSGAPDPPVSTSSAPHLTAGRSTPGSGSADPTRTTLHPARDRLTKEGLWWGVDSTTPITAAALANVRYFYRGHRTPVVWGRYLSGHFAVHPAEISFAARQGIALYLLVPDDNCSGCGGGDVCGGDITAQQAHRDARGAYAAARRLRLPTGTAIFKDIEEVSGCHGELTAAYLDAWFTWMRATRYRPAFYGNSTNQHFDFPRAFCSAVRRDPALRHVVLAQDEPEPQIGAPRGAVGPANAPPFRPNRPRCAPLAQIKIWQYGESLTADNVTDIDEVRPDTPGLLLPDGSVSS